jgi:hypothetical protein
MHLFGRANALQVCDVGSCKTQSSEIRVGELCEALLVEGRLEKLEGEGAERC